MTFVSLVGMIDPPRKEVKPTIVAARSAGIRVCMITGDHPRYLSSSSKICNLSELLLQLEQNWES